MKYALFGASGAVGIELAKVLAANNQPFRVVGRREDELKRRFSKYEPLVEYCAADLMNPEDAARAAKGVETIFYLAGVPYNKFELHPKMSKVCTEAAANAGVKRFVQLSTLYSYGLMQGRSVNEDHPRNPHTYKGKMRKEQEDIVWSAHNENGMQVTMLIAPDFYGGDSELSFIHLIFEGAVKNKKADAIGPIDKPHEFVYVPDLARTLYQLSQKPEAYGKKWNLGGVGYISVKEMADKIYQKAGHKSANLRVAGLWVLKLIGLFNPLMKEFVEMQYLLSEPLFVDDTRLKALLPELTKTSYDEGIEKTLALYRARV